jgi:leucyl-tRNA synthetase
VSFVFDEHAMIVTDEVPTKDNLKTLHKTIKKWQMTLRIFQYFGFTIYDLCQRIDCSRLPFPCCSDPLAVVISPYAPHIAEELWSLLGNEGSIATVSFPVFEPKHLIESSKEYPVSFNGKMRFTIDCL